MAMSHWSHKFADTPFGCNYAATNTRTMIVKFFLFLLGLILIPLGFIGLPLLLAIGYGLFGGIYTIYIAFTYKDYNPQWYHYLIRFILIILSFPAAGIILAFCAVGGAIASGLAAILVIPAMIFHTYLFARSFLWWRMNLKIARQ